MNIDCVYSQWIKEDVPYFDLTTFALEIGHLRGEMRFYSREHGILSGIEDVEALCLTNGLEIKRTNTSGEPLSPQQTFFIATGTFSQLYKVYKVSQNIFEHASGIATRTNKLVQLLKEINVNIPILTTRKTFPGTRNLAIRSVLAGGGLPHRLGLSETIVIFKHHLQFLQKESELHERLLKMKKHHVEKKIIIEVESVDEAKQYAKLPIDGIQYDKFTPNELKSTVKQLRKLHPNLIHLATGGIDENNIQVYALTDVDGIVTSAVYHSKPLDVGVDIAPI